MIFFIWFFGWYQTTSGIATGLLVTTSGPTSHYWLYRKWCITSGYTGLGAYGTTLLLDSKKLAISQGIYGANWMMPCAVVRPEKKTSGEEKTRGTRSRAAWPERRREVQGRSLLNRLAWTIQKSWGDLIGAARLEQIQDQTFIAVHPDL